MVREIGDLWLASEGKFTVTGSWLEDRERLPGLWRCVYEYVSIRRYAEKIVENTLDLVSSDG